MNLKCFINEFDFNEEHLLTKMKILELNQNGSVVWECLESDPEWVGTLVVFRLKEENGITTLSLGHFGWREISDYYRWCIYNWSMLLKRLKEYCES